MGLSRVGEDANGQTGLLAADVVHLLLESTRRLGLHTEGLKLSNDRTRGLVSGVRFEGLLKECLCGSQLALVHCTLPKRE